MAELAELLGPFSNTLTFISGFLPIESDEMVLMKAAFRALFSRLAEMEQKIDDLSTITQWENQKTIYASSFLKIEEGYREMDVRIFVSDLAFVS